MSMFNVQRAPSKTRSPFEGPSAGNKFQDFGGGAVGSVGGRNYGNTPWWMLPAGTNNNPGFIPSAISPTTPVNTSTSPTRSQSSTPQSSNQARNPAIPVQGSVPSGSNFGSPQDFFSALAGLISNAPKNAPRFSNYLSMRDIPMNSMGMTPMNPAVAQMISERQAMPTPGQIAAAARLERQGGAVNSRPRNIRSDARAFERIMNNRVPVGQNQPTVTGFGDPILPLSENPQISTPFTPPSRIGVNPTSQRQSPTFPRGLPSPGSLGSRNAASDGVIIPGANGRPRIPSEGRRWNFNPISPRRSDYRGPGVEDFRAWARAAPGGNFM
jgi:hypothetical protein